MANPLSAEDYCIIHAEDATAASALMTLEDDVARWLKDNLGWQPCGGRLLAFSPRWKTISSRKPL